MFFFWSLYFLWLRPCGSWCNWRSCESQMNKQKWRKVKGLGWVKSTWNKASVCEYLRMQCLCTTVKSCLSPASSWQHLLRFLMHFRFSGPSTASKANDTVKPSRYRFCPKTKRCPVEPLKKTWRRGLLDYSVSKRFNRKKICFFFVLVLDFFGGDPLHQSPSSKKELLSWSFKKDWNPR